MKPGIKKNKWQSGKRNAKQPELSDSGPCLYLKREQVNHVSIYVDGACQPNPGLGGYSFAVIENNEVLHEYNKRVEDTTNNRMEMSAIIDALQWVRTECPGEKVVIYTDSEYCHQGITKWHYGWEKKQWKDVKNSELWQEMVTLKNHCSNVQYVWVRGHSGNKWNEYVDKLAVSAITGKRESDKKIKKPIQVNQADQLLMDIYREMWKDAFCTGSHGLRTNITEYLKQKQLIS